MQSFEIKVEGMTCEHCVKSVGNVLREKEGVVDYSIDLETGVVEITAQDGENVREAIVQAINNTDIYKAA